MRFLEPFVDDVAAWSALHTVRFRRTRRLLKWCVPPRGVLRNGNVAKPQRQRGQLPYLELMWLPHYLVTFEAALKDRVRDVNVIVGAHEPMTTVIDLADARWESDADREHFPASLSQEAAVRAARRALLEIVLRSPGWARKPDISEPRCVELVQYPLWVYYFARRRDIVDVKILDAVTGRPTGSKAKLALLAALAAAQKPS